MSSVNGGQIYLLLIGVKIWNPESNSEKDDMLQSKAFPFTARGLGACSGHRSMTTADGGNIPTMVTVGTRVLYQNLSSRCAWTYSGTVLGLVKRQSKDAGKLSLAKSSFAIDIKAPSGASWKSAAATKRMTLSSSYFRPTSALIRACRVTK